MFVVSSCSSVQKGTAAVHVSERWLLLIYNKKTDVNGKRDGSTVFAVQGAGEIPCWKDSTQYIVKTK